MSDTQRDDRLAHYQAGVEHESSGAEQLLGRVGQRVALSSRSPV